MAGMIKGFKDAATEAIFKGETPKGLQPSIVKVARRKLGYLNAAVDLNDLKAPPGNKLHALSKDREGQHAIWVNDQYRVCFVWTPEGPTEVEITDYHD